MTTNNEEVQQARVGFDNVMDTHFEDWETSLDAKTIETFKAIYAAGVNDTMLGVTSMQTLLRKAIDNLVQTYNQTSEAQSQLLSLITDSLSPPTDEVSS